MASVKEEFKRDDTFLTALKGADITQSLHKALFENPNRSPTQQSQDVSLVLKFIEDNITNTENCEINQLIEANLKYLALNLNQYSVKLVHNARNVEVPYHLDQRRVLENQWIKCGIGLHKLMDKIIKQSLNKPNNAYIFYSLYILKGLCLGQSEAIITKIINETDIIKFVLEIMDSDGNSNNMNKTWIEQFMCVQLLNYFILYADPDKTIWVNWSEKHNLNVIKLLIKISCNCFIKYPYYYNTMNEYQKKIILLHSDTDLQSSQQIKSQDDIPTYLRSPYADKDILRKSLHVWLYRTRIGSLDALKAYSYKYWTLDSLINGDIINSQYLKRLLQISSMTARQGKQTFPPQVNAIDVLVLLSQNKSIAKAIVSDEDLMKNLIICIRSRGQVCEFNNANLLVLIYFITVQHKVVPRYYFHDLIYSLMDTIESEWKNISLLGIFNLPSTNELTIRTLQYLFGAPRFEIIDKEEYYCVVCQSVFNNPYSISCGHTMCYTCLTNFIATSHTNYDVHFRGYYKPHHCPLCRKKFEGKFDRDDKKSSFTLNYQLQNKIYESSIIIIHDQDDDDDGDEKKDNNNNYYEQYKDFKGTQCQFWMYLKTNHLDKLFDEEMAKCKRIKAEFITFCEFMEKNTKIYKGNIKAERKENILKARDIKTEGNTLFKNKNYMGAILKYREALKICPLFHEDRITYLSNITLCYIKLKDYINAFRTSQNGLMLTPNHIKLYNNSILSLSNLLCNDEERKKLNEYIHDKINVCKCNDSCLNKRCYDVILYQLSWECEFHYTLKKIMNGNRDNQQYADNLRKTDEFITNIRSIDGQIENYGNMNFEEYQFESYVDIKNDFKKAMHDFIVEKLYENDVNSDQQEINSNNLIIEIIDDLLTKFNFEATKKLKINELIEMIDVHWKQNVFYKFYCKYIKSKVIEFIVTKSKILELVNESGEIYIKLTPKHKQYKDEYDKIENKAKIFNDWNDNNDDFITAPLYKWERI